MLANSNLIITIILMGNSESESLKGANGHSNIGWLSPQLDKPVVRIIFMSRMIEAAKVHQERLITTKKVG